MPWHVYPPYGGPGTGDEGGPDDNAGCVCGSAVIRPSRLGWPMSTLGVFVFRCAACGASAEVMARWPAEARLVMFSDRWACDQFGSLWLCPEHADFLRDDEDHEEWCPRMTRGSACVCAASIGRSFRQSTRAKVRGRRVEKVRNISEDYL